MTGTSVLAIGAVVLGVAWRRRPPPRRAGSLWMSTGRPSAPRRPSPVARLGGTVRSRSGRPPDAELDRHLGWSLLVAAGAALVEPVLAPLGAAVWIAGHWRRARRRRARDERVVDDQADVLDLFLLAVEGGCTPRLAVEAVAEWVSGPWQVALRQVAVTVGQGLRLGTAVEALTVELGDPARPLVVALLDAEHYGTPLAPSLDRLAREAAVERRRRAEERARRVPVQLLFPLVFCTLPAFVLLTVVPLLAGTLPTLSP